MRGREADTLQFVNDSIGSLDNGKDGASIQSGSRS
jgi:hypothetical protein